MNHKGVEYVLTATDEADIWQWRFQIGDMIKAGKTQTRLAPLAQRRVQLKIDAALKSIRAASGLARLQPPLSRASAIGNSANEF